MSAFLTLKARKAARLAALRDALATLRVSLADYARANGGRFLLFGSAARGDLRHDSDIDLLVDFPEDTLAAAWRFVEDECWRPDLEPDVLPLAWCKLGFLAHVAAETVELR
ncbi:MAG: nucleotidyltransferase domain-containing protein [Acetobacteraceae bacterium]|nr:nucleotidyltransferase domain-containing protein [Acetobacteraceae bacterium]